MTEIVRDHLEPMSPPQDESLARGFLSALFSTSVMLACHLFAFIVLYYVAVAVGATFIERIEAQNMSVPGVVGAVIRFCYWMANYGYLLIGLLLIEGCVLFGLRLYSRRSNGVRVFLFSAVLMLIIGGIGWILFLLTMTLQHHAEQHEATRTEVDVYAAKW